MKLRRTPCPNCRDRVLEFDGVATCRRCRRLSVDGETRVELTAREFVVMRCYLLAAGRPVSVVEVMESVWPDPDDEPDTADRVVVQYQTRLRHKLGQWLEIRRYRSGMHQFVRVR